MKLREFLDDFEVDYSMLPVEEQDFEIEVKVGDSMRRVLATHWDFFGELVTIEVEENA